MSDPAFSSFLVREKIEQFRGFGGVMMHFLLVFGVLTFCKPRMRLKNDTTKRISD